MANAYLFEAKGIQRYIFAAGALRDLIGASDLVACLASSDGGDLIGKAIELVREEHAFSGVTVEFSRRAGGSFCLHGPLEFLVRIRAQWRLAVMTSLPGLEFVDSLGEGANELAALANAYDNAGLRTNMAASVLPLGRPVSAIAPLTGRAATAAFDYRNQDGESETVLADAITAPQRRRGQDLQRRMGEREKAPLDGVAARFLGGMTPAEANLRYLFPRNVDPRDGDTVENPLFPFRSRDFRIAVVHADISDLGEAFRRKGSQSNTVASRRTLATAIESAILRAVRDAAKDHLLAATHCGVSHSDSGFLVAPVRPIVLGGDDVTLICRADVALPFTAALLKNIEQQTSNSSIGGLSACAGVAIAQKSLPFIHAYALAESLCDFAKAEAKKTRGKECEPYPSAIAFHHQTQTATERYEDDILPFLARADGCRLTANPYPLDRLPAERMNRIPFDSLMKLATAIATLPGAENALRALREEAETAPGAADAAWRRFVDYRRKNSEPEFKKFVDALADLGVELNDDFLPFEEASRSTPLFDALVLIDIGAIVISASGAKGKAA